MNAGLDPRARDALPIPQLALAALFITGMLVMQVTASKVLAFDIPVSIPLAGDQLLVPAGVFAYALTFFASDCYAELYGKRPAQALVNVAFGMNFVLLALLGLAIWAPVFANSPVGAEPFANVLGASVGIVVGSLLAYVVSQNWDVIVFHRLREATDGDALWLRNVASTASSQLIDTVIFISIAFVVFQGLSPAAALSLIVGQYVVKLGLALLDTPFVYLVVGTIRRRESAPSEPAPE
jgi:hypothetical protein